MWAVPRPSLPCRCSTCTCSSLAAVVGQLAGAVRAGVIDDEHVGVIDGGF